MRLMKYFILVCLAFFIINCEKNPIDNDNSNPPYEERILFIRNVKNELSQICTMKPDGSDLEIISETEYGYYNIGYIDARWSPDKSKIVIVGGPESSKDIFALWLMDMDGDFIRKLANNGIWSVWQNNSKIFYNKPRTFVGSTADIYLIDIEKDDEILIFEQNDTLSFSFTDINKTGEIAIGYFWSISLNSLLAKFPIEDINNFTILSYEDTYLGVKPKLSPDEKKIIFAQGIYRNNDLYSLELETSTIANITNDPGEYRSISWSPDGKKIAFSKENSSLEGEFKSTCDIFIIDLPTNQITNLTAALSDSISSHVMDWK